MSALSEEELEQLTELTRALQMRAIEMLHIKLKSSPGRPQDVTMPVKTSG